ncbi:MAG: hypothetical protein WBQ73_01185 [Candidatus Babeliales bacterium]
MKCSLLLILKPMQLTNKGATLFELLVALSFFCMILLCSTHYFSLFDSVIIKTELNHLFTACFYLQKTALVTNKPQIIHFNTALNNYTIEGRVHTLPHWFSLTLPDKPLYGPPSSPYSLVKNSVTFKDNSIIFYPNGIIQSGTVYLTNNNNGKVYAFSNGISQFSFLRMYQYDGQWHRLE